MGSNLIKVINEQFREKILETLGACIADNKLPAVPIKNFNVEIPANRLYGDLATNVALVCAKSFEMPALNVAQIIMDNMDFEDTYFDRYTIVSPGFINVFVKQSWFKDVLININNDQNNYGRSDIGSKSKVMVEFVSANPTGPMHIGNARGGVIGDCLASVLELCNYDVNREFYVNDAGNQIYKFGKSLEARYLQIFKGQDAVEFPEDGYKGKDIVELAELFAQTYGDKFIDIDADDRQKALIDFALPINIDKLKTDLSRYKIHYDVWFKESTLYKNKSIDKVIELFKEANSVYEKEGALWFAASKYGADKDEVLVKANGFSTYFAADVAYHYNKFVTRNFDKVINVWGADHHGHVARLKSAISALGIDSSKLDIILMQLVKLTQGGQVVKMSKRTGKSITLVDLLEEVSVDAARFFFNMREANSHLDFDLNLAVEKSSENPVYYVQYAHARICSILSKSKVDEHYINLDIVNNFDFNLLLDEERELIKILAIYPSEIETISRTYDCSILTKYAINLAANFHKFYSCCKVVTDEEDITNIRLLLCVCTKIVLKSLLSLMKITAPETM